MFTSGATTATDGAIEQMADDAVFVSAGGSSPWATREWPSLWVLERNCYKLNIVFISDSTRMSSAQLDPRHALAIQQLEIGVGNFDQGAGGFCEP